MIVVATHASLARDVKPVDGGTTMRDGWRGLGRVSVATCAALTVVLVLPVGCRDGEESDRPAAAGSGDLVAAAKLEKLPLDPSVAPWRPAQDRSAVAAKRTPWDNFTSADPLVVNRTDMAPSDKLEAKWAQYKADPIGSMLRDGTINFQLVNSMYRADLLKFSERGDILKRMRAYIEKEKGDPALKANFLVALVHIGFEEEALGALDEFKGEPWFKTNYDANFYAATLLFRHRRFAEAVPFLEQALALNPDDWTKLWLRLALHGDESEGAKARRDGLFSFGPHMGTGKPSAFPFRDRSDAWGFRRWHLAGAVAFVDLDNDSYVDFVGNGVYASPELYRYQPGIGFERERHKVLESIANVPSACVSADFDNDGYADLYFPSAAWFGAGPNKLLRNDAGKGFTDVSELGDAALLDQNSCGVSTLDYDRDGLLDMVVTGTKGGSARLLRNTGDFVFKDVTREAGIRHSPQPTVSLALGDIDNDGLMDIFLNGVGTNSLYRNKGDGTFVEEAQARGVRDGTPFGFGAWMFDYDNDGDLDILASNFSSDGEKELLILRGFREKIAPHQRYQPPALYRNDGTGHFTNVSAEAGFTPCNVMGAQFIDFDLDGDPDIVQGPGSHPLETIEPVFVYRNDGGDRFTNITPFEDPLYYGKFHGMAFADLDRDGDPDLYLNNGGVLLSDRFRDLVLENTTTGKRWLHLKLEGTQSNRSAVGARVVVHVAGRKLHQYVVAGQGFSSTNSPYLIFGLATDGVVDKVEIAWPSGGKQDLGPFAADQALVVTEGKQLPRRVY